MKGHKEETDMPDWAMILLKCVLWFAVAYPMLMTVVFLVRPGQVTKSYVRIPVAAFIILAALEGWITP